MTDRVMPINLTKSKICLTHSYNYITEQKETFLNQKNEGHVISKSNSGLLSSKCYSQCGHQNRPVRSDMIQPVLREQ